MPSTRRGPETAIYQQSDADLELLHDRLSGELQALFCLNRDWTMKEDRRAGTVERIMYEIENEQDERFQEYADSPHLVPDTPSLDDQGLFLGSYAS